MKVLGTTSTDPMAGLRTDRTIARHLVHRAALSEVYLADFSSVDERTFRAAAQLPATHFYYGDHTVRPALHDPLGVFESVRQMLLCAMHLQHDADFDTKAITADTSMEITDARPLRADGRALDLAMFGNVAMEKTHEGAVSRVVHEVRVLAGDREIGTVRVDTALRPSAPYEKLRMSHRDTPPPSSGAWPVPRPANPVAPHLVGREDARNVVIGDARTTADTLTAHLFVPVSHPSMFDHQHDHVPGPVLMEAARQAALLLSGDCLGLSPARLYLQYVYAGYQRFVELDSDILVRARLLGDQGSGAGSIEVTFEQSDEAAARLEVRLAGTSHLDRETTETGDAP